VLKMCVVRRLGHGAGLGDFLLGRHVGPEEGDAVGPVGAGECPLQVLEIVHVGFDDLGAQRRQRARFVGRGVARQGAGGEGAGLVPQDGAYQPAPLGAGGTDHGNDLLFRHCDSLR